MEDKNMKTQLKFVTKTAITAIIVVFTQATSIAATITSATSGDWGTTTTWAGGVVPTSSDDVVITNNHKINLSNSRTINSLTIQNSSLGTSYLDIEPTGSITLNGNLTMTSSNTNRRSELIVQGSVSVLGNISFTSTSNSFVVINIYEGGSFNLAGTFINPNSGSILSDINCSFTYSGSSNQTIPLHSNVNYFNLIIDKTGSNTATLSAAITTSNLSGNITVREGRFSNGGFAISGNIGEEFIVENGGVYIMTATTSLPVDFTHNFQSGSTIIYSSASAQTVSAPNAGNFFSLNFEGVGTKTLANSITAAGNLNISAGTLDASASNYNINVGGNWNNSGGTFNARSATVTFNGSAAQSISANGNSFYNIVFNNSAAGTSAIILNSDVEISNACTMTDGIINTGANKLYLTNSTASNLTGFSSACYVNGNLRRNIASNTSTYAFPVGIGSYQRIDVKNNNLSGVTYIDGFFSSLVRHDDADLGVDDGVGMEYLSVSLSGMWTLEPNNAPSGGSYDILGYVANISGVYDNEFAIVKRPVGSPDATSWTTAGGTINGSNGIGRKVSDGYALRMGLTGFSEFAIASTQPSNPLPIQLINFEAKINKLGIVDIKWATATEINNDYFSIERSKDGINFEEIRTVKGAGNSSRTLLYTTKDGKPLKGTSYYRLKQTDFDGTSSHSAIVSVSYSGFTTMGEIVANINIYPNPVASGGFLNIISNNESALKVALYEAATGKKVAEELINGENSAINIGNNFSAGVYLLKVVSDYGVNTHRIIIQ
jgi:hypothetical protein